VRVARRSVCRATLGAPSLLSIRARECFAAPVRKPSDRNAELGVIQVLLHRFTTYRLPYALQLKAQVDRGERLSEYELRFVKKVVEESVRAHRLAAKHAKYQDLVSQATSLFSEIMSKALENEQAALQQQSST
jgi:hypothetical protein